MTTHDPTDHGADLDPGEKRLLRSLPRDLPPPPHLERRLLTRLRHQRLVHRPGSTGTRRVLGLAASLALFAVGFATGRQTTAGGPDPSSEVLSVRSSGSQVLMLLYEDSAFSPPRSGPDLAREYGEWWTASLRSPSGILWADRLSAWDTIVEGGGSRPHEVTPPIGSLAGFFLVTVADRQEAVRVAAGSPHVRYGGRIVLREVE